VAGCNDQRDPSRCSSVRTSHVCHPILPNLWSRHRSGSCPSGRNPRPDRPGQSHYLSAADPVLAPLAGIRDLIDLDERSLEPLPGRRCPRVRELAGACTWPAAPSRSLEPLPDRRCPRVRKLVGACILAGWLRPWDRVLPSGGDKTAVGKEGVVQRAGDRGGVERKKTNKTNRLTCRWQFM
jgi:hypothetical protein